MNRVRTMRSAALAAVLASAGPAFAGGVCGDAGAGCCAPHEGTACDDAVCCQFVCGIDFFCCDEVWDQGCADLAAICPGCGGPPQAEGLEVVIAETGQIFLSADGAGTNNPDGVAMQVEKPNDDAVVLGAYFACAGLFGRFIDDGDVWLAGSAVSWDGGVSNGAAGSEFFFHNVFADVTSIVKPLVDAAPAGLVDLSQVETGTETIDGCGLYVIFSDPHQTTTNTAFILFGGQATEGDSFAVTLAEPLGEGDTAELGLGISFGAQDGEVPAGSHECGCEYPMFSYVDVNGVRITSCAGNTDDGDGLLANGNLITVGGLGDGADNPDDPFQEAADEDCPPPPARVIDDELYDINVPGPPASGGTLINVSTFNPSDDDNIFTGHIFVTGPAVIGEGATLTPVVAANEPGTQHTVTATVVDDLGDPVEGRFVGFVVIAGPNLNADGGDVTDADGEATFTYTSNGETGVDSIQASFLDSQEQEQLSNVAFKFWDDDRNGNGVPDTCDLECAGFGGKCALFEGCGDAADCNGNGVPDDADILQGTSHDFNGNGVPDECEGQPNFQPPQLVPVEGTPNIEAVGDLDGDGDDDVAAVVPGEFESDPGAVQIFLNAGNDVDTGEWLGLVPQLPTIPVGANPTAIALGFFDDTAGMGPSGPMTLDIAVTNRNDDSVSILLNNGDGTFAAASPPTVPAGDGPNAIRTGDVNFDTHTDLAVANADGAGTALLILLGNGDGTFNPPSAQLFVPLDVRSFALSADDFDNNKCPDVAGIGQVSGAAEGAPGQAFILFHFPDGSFSGPVYADVGFGPTDLATADLDGDGDADLVSSNSGGNTISVLLNMGAASQLAGPANPFAPAFAVNVGQTPVSVDAADLSGDGVPDLAIVADDPELGQSVQVLTNLGPGGALGGNPIQFAIRPVSVGDEPQYVARGDFNGDLKADLATVNQVPGQMNGSVAVLLSDPSPIAYAASADVSPGVCPHHFYRPSSSGAKTKVALIERPGFRIADVDVPTLALSRAADVGIAVAPTEVVARDVTSPSPPRPPCDCHVFTKDGLDDLDMSFRSSDLASGLAITNLAAGAQVQVVLSGLLLDGTPFEATDCIVIVASSDIDLDGSVGVDDFMAIFASWGACSGCPADLDGSGFVDVGDMLIVLTNWG